jgi:hypothetical protein
MNSNARLAMNTNLTGGGIGFLGEYLRTEHDWELCWLAEAPWFQYGSFVRKRNLLESWDYEN